MSENSHSPSTKWILIGTAILGLVAALFVTVARYYDIRTARAAAERAEAERAATERGAADRAAKDRAAAERAAEERTAEERAAPPKKPDGPEAAPQPPVTPAVKPPPVTAVGMPPFREDFAKVEEGALPEGWTGDDAITVRKGGDRARLEVSGKGQRTVTLPKVRAEGDFYLECEFTLAWERPQLELTLEGKDGAPNIGLTATATGGGTSVATTLRVTLADLEPRESTKVLEALSTAGLPWQPLYTLRLERRGAIYRVKVNGEGVVAQPIRGYGDFTGLRLSLPGGSEARFYSIQVGPLAAPKNP